MMNEKEIDSRLNLISDQSQMAITADRFIHSPKDFRRCDNLLKNTADEIRKRILPSLKLNGSFDPLRYLDLVDSLMDLRKCLRQFGLKNIQQIYRLMFRAGPPKNWFNEKAIALLVNVFIKGTGNPNFRKVADKLEKRTGKTFTEEQVRKIYKRWRKANPPTKIKPRRKANRKRT